MDDLVIKCPSCGKTFSVSAAWIGKKARCNACQTSFVVQAQESKQPGTPDGSESKPSEETSTLACPRCSAPLRVARQLDGKSIRCNACRALLAVAADPWRLSVVADALPPAQAQTTSPPKLPPGAPPLPPRIPPVPKAQKPWGDPSTVSPDADVVGISRASIGLEHLRDAAAAGTAGVKKRAMALKLKYDTNDLQTAINGQLETLGTLILTHRPATVHVGEQISELSQIQTDLALKQTALNSLRQTKGGRSVIKQVNEEVAKLHDCRKAITVAIGKETLRIRPDMPGAAGCYAALDRLQPSLEAKQNELKRIEDEIGPVWSGAGETFGRMKRPLMIIGAVLGGLLLACVFWMASVALSSGTGFFGSGYQADCKVVDLKTSAGLEVTVKGKAAKIAAILTAPGGRSETEVIEAEKMITNMHTVELPMKHPQPGRYVLALKTFTPEAVVFQKRMDFSLKRLTVEGVMFFFKPVDQKGGLSDGATLMAATVIVRREGNLPVEVSDAFIAIDGSDPVQGEVAKTYPDADGHKKTLIQTITHQLQPVNVAFSSVPPTKKMRDWEGEARRRESMVWPPGNAVFRPGERYLVTGRLSFVGGQQPPLHFQKEIVITSEIVLTPEVAALRCDSPEFMDLLQTSLPRKLLDELNKEYAKKASDMEYPDDSK